MKSANYLGFSPRESQAKPEVTIWATAAPAGVWQSDTQVVPQARCHPHCNTDPNHGSDFGDPVSYSFAPRENPPAGYHYIYANPRFGSTWGDGWPFEVWNPFQSDEGGATLTGWARSAVAYFTVLLDRFAVPNN